MIEFLEPPVMNTRRRAPARNASSAAYWISGLSTTGTISLGLALVAGRKRVPRPATGKTAVRISDLKLGSRGRCKRSKDRHYRTGIATETCRFTTRLPVGKAADQSRM